MTGVNRLPTKGKKLLPTTDKTQKKKILTTDRKNVNRLPTWTEIAYIFFSKRRVYCIFSTFLGSNQRYHVTSLFTSQYHKTRILKSVCRAYAKNFYNPPSPKHYMRQMLRLILKENSFQFNGKLYLQNHSTVMGTKTAVSSANIFMSCWNTKSKLKRL